MSQVVLTQVQPSPFSQGPGIDFACTMKDASGNSQQVVVNVNTAGGSIKFFGYGPSTGGCSNVVETGPQGFPTEVTFDFAGTGNLPGKNDAAYTGTGDWKLGWVYHELTHSYTVAAVSGTATLNY